MNEVAFCQSLRGIYTGGDGIIQMVSPNKSLEDHASGITIRTSLKKKILG